MDVKAYAASVGRARVTVQREVMAAKVAAVFNGEHDLSKQFLTLVEIHAAPEWLWSALVAAMVESEWSVEQTRKQVARFKGAPEPLAEDTAEKIAIVPNWNIRWAAIGLLYAACLTRSTRPDRSARRALAPGRAQGGHQPSRRCSEAGPARRSATGPLWGALRRFPRRLSCVGRLSGRRRGNRTPDRAVPGRKRPRNRRRPVSGSPAAWRAIPAAGSRLPSSSDTCPR